MDDKEILDSISDNLRILRLQKRISQDELAERAGISTKYLNMIENRKANPTILVVIKLCYELGASLDKLYNINKIVGRVINR